MIFNSDQKSVLRGWRETILTSSDEYKYYALIYTRNYYIFGTVCVILLSIFSTTGFVAINVCPDGNECHAKVVIEWVNFAFDLLGAIMLGVFTFVNFGGHAEQCRTRKIELDALARTIEESFGFDETSNVDPQDWIKNIGQQYNEIQRKQIILGLGWLFWNKKEAMEVRTCREPLDKSSSDVFKQKFRVNKIFNHQLDRLNQ